MVTLVGRGVCIARSCRSYWQGAWRCGLLAGLRGLLGTCRQGVWLYLAGRGYLEGRKEGEMQNSKQTECKKCAFKVITAAIAIAIMIASFPLPSSLSLSFFLFVCQLAPFMRK